jgi:hypothetical protein
LKREISPAGPGAFRTIATGNSDLVHSGKFGVAQSWQDRPRR